MPPRTLQPPDVNVSRSGPAPGEGQKQGSLRIGGWIPRSRRPGKLSRRGFHTGAEGAAVQVPSTFWRGRPGRVSGDAAETARAQALRPRAGVRHRPGFATVRGLPLSPPFRERSPHVLCPGNREVCSSFTGNICSRSTFRNWESHHRAGLR